MELFNSGWGEALGVLSILYILFGSDRWVKVISFLILVAIVATEIGVKLNWF